MSLRNMTIFGNDDFNHDLTKTKTPFATTQFSTTILDDMRKQKTVPTLTGNARTPTHKTNADVKRIYVIFNIVDSIPADIWLVH